jgi:hypothetical protein
MSSEKKVFVDFGNADDSDTIRLVTRGTLSDLERFGIQLEEGLELGITDGEISADAIVHYSDGVWVAKVLRWEQ